MRDDRRFSWLTALIILIAALVTLLVIAGGLGGLPLTVNISTPAVVAEGETDSAAEGETGAETGGEATIPVVEATAETTPEAAATELPAIATNNALVTVAADVLGQTATAQATEAVLPAVATNNALATNAANLLAQPTTAELTPETTSATTVETTAAILPAVATNDALATNAANLLALPTTAATIEITPEATAESAALPTTDAAWTAAVEALLSPMPTFAAESTAETTPEATSAEQNVVLLVITPTPEITVESPAEATAEPTVELLVVTPTAAVTAEAASEVTAEATPCCEGVLLEIPTAEATASTEDPGVDVAVIYHDSRSDLYRTPGGAVPFGTPVTLRLRTGAGNVDTVTARVWNTFTEKQTLLPMQVVATTSDGYDLWEATLNIGTDPANYWYRFIITRGNQTVYYEDDIRDTSGAYLAYREGGMGQVYPESPDYSFQITAYDPTYDTPDWMKNAVVYQIFPDRFRNGDTANDPADGSETFYGSIPLDFHETWNERPLDGRVDFLPDGSGYWNSDFFGGDLAGITEKLDYLHDLGVTAIYLNPIFLARSNHRYDTADFLQIDPYLGTLEDFQTLVAEAEKRGIRLILDGVLNHMSSDSAYFDRYHRFEGDEGACENVKSEYRDWFYFEPPRANQPSPCVGKEGPVYYQSWAGFDSIPKINNGFVETRRYFYLGPNSVVRTWGAEGIGGWRLDVAGDIDNGRDPSNVFWEGFRTVAKQVNPDTIIIGEEWGDASEWFQGKEWDSTMNYRLRAGILGFVRDENFTDNDSNGDRIIYALPPSELDNTIRSIAEDYPAPAYHALLNLLDSHDTSRLSFVVGDDANLQKLAALTVFTLPGAPTTYYGDEIALKAPSQADSGGTLQDDPYNRAPYPWSDTDGDTYPAPDEDMLAYYQQLGALRNANPALRTGEMITLATDDQHGIYAYLRLDTAAGNAALVILNNGNALQIVQVDYSGYLPTGLTLEPAFGGEAINTDNLSVQVTIPANSGNAWTFSGDSAVFATLPPPASVGARGETGSVELKWEAVAGAGGYIVYRSPVAVGGFEPLFGTPIGETTYTDDTTANGFAYYYAVAAVTDTSLIGDLSASTRAVPGYAIDETFYVGDSAGAREVERAFGAKVDVEAALRIADVTGTDSPVPGIRAEAALLPAESDPAAAVWQPMTYARSEDGADVYTAALEPEDIGEFVTVARFSTNAGQTWTEVKLDDGTFPTLNVIPSADTTPPPAPAELRVVRASLSGVLLEWDAVTDDTLFAYRVYRSVGAGEPEALADVLAANGPTYFDATVVEGETYTYAVAAVDGALNASEPTAAEPVQVARLVVPVTLTVEVPARTNSDVYIAGDFHSEDYPLWDPAGLPMTQADNTHWTITLNIPEGETIEYKYVRGDWSAVEKDATCQEIANRRVTVRPGTSGTVDVTDSVIKWRDLDQCG